MDVVRLVKLTFYELSHARDQKFVIYSLTFDYLRFMCLGNGKVKAKVYEHIRSFFDSIDSNSELFMKFVYFFEEFIDNNEAFLLGNETLVAKYIDCIIAWIVRENEQNGQRVCILLSVLRKFTVLDNNSINQNQKLVMTSIFSQKYSSYFSLFKG